MRGRPFGPLSLLMKLAPSPLTFHYQLCDGKTKLWHIMAGFLMTALNATWYVLQISVINDSSFIEISEITVFLFPVTCFIPTKANKIIHTLKHVDATDLSGYDWTIYWSNSRNVLYCMFSLFRIILHNFFHEICLYFEFKDDIQRIIHLLAQCQCL